MIRLAYSLTITSKWYTLWKSEPNTRPSEPPKVYLLVAQL